MEKLNKAILEARKSKDVLRKNLLLTLKGDYETEVKNGANPGEITLGKIAKKMAKGLYSIGTEESEKEIAILEQYLPKKYNYKETLEYVNSMVLSGAITADPTDKRFIGECMKHGKDLLDGKVLKDVLNNEF